MGCWPSALRVRAEGHATLASRACQSTLLERLPLLLHLSLELELLLVHQSVRCLLDPLKLLVRRPALVTLLRHEVLLRAPDGTDGTSRPEPPALALEQLGFSSPRRGPMAQ